MLVMSMLLASAVFSAPTAEDYEVSANAEAEDYEGYETLETVYEEAEVYDIIENIETVYEGIAPVSGDVLIFRAQVIANPFTTLMDQVFMPPANSVLWQNPTVTVRVLPGFDANFIGEGTNATFRVGDTNAANYIGQQVIIHVVDDNNGMNMRIVSIEPEAGRNISVTFPIRLFEEFDTSSAISGVRGGVIRFLATDEDRNLSSINLAPNFTVIYNGRFAWWDDVFTGWWGDTIRYQEFANGTITVLNSDGIGGADMIFVNSPRVAVVDNVFERTIFDRTWNFSSINLRSDMLVAYSITRDGVPIEVEDLNPWDVLMVEYNPFHSDDGLYTIRVVTNVIEGTVIERGATMRSSDGWIYRIGNETFLASEGAYIPWNGIPFGMAGRFYIDEFGNIAAFRRAPREYTYGFIFAAAQEFGFGGRGERGVLRIMDSNGDISDRRFANVVTVESPDGSTTFRGNGNYPDEDWGPFGFDIQNAEGQLIRFNLNAAGEINVIEVAAMSGNLEFDHVMVSSGSFEFNEWRDRFLRLSGSGRSSFFVSEDTMFFFIGLNGGLYDAGNAAVLRKDALIDEFEYSRVYAFGEDERGDARVVLIIGDEPCGGFPKEPVVFGQMFDTEFYRIFDFNSNNFNHNTVFAQISDYYFEKYQNGDIDIFMAAYTHNGRMTRLGFDVSYDYDDYNLFMIDGVGIGSNIAYIRVFMWERGAMIPLFDEPFEIRSMGAPLPSAPPLGYGFIFGADQAIGFGGEAERGVLFIMQMDGHVVTRRFADVVTAVSPDGNTTFRGDGGEFGDDWGPFSSDIWEFYGQLIRFSVNERGEINVVEVASTGGANVDLTVDHVIMGDGSYTFEARFNRLTRETGTIGRNIFSVGDDTKIFWIATDGSGYFDTDESEIRTISTLRDGVTYENLQAFGEDEYGNARVLVIIGQNSTVQPGELAMFLSQTAGRNANNETILNVTFFQGGELRTLSTTPQAVEVFLLNDLNRGDTFWFSTNGRGEIYVAKVIFTLHDLADFSRENGSGVLPWLYMLAPVSSSFGGANELSTWTLDLPGSTSQIRFGPVHSRSGNRVFVGPTIAPDNEIWVMSTDSFNIPATANIYVLDYSLSGAAQLRVGSVALPPKSWTDLD